MADDRTVTAEPLFEFTMRYIDKDPTGYYYERWDRATPTLIIAPTKAEAYTALWAMLGPSPRHWTWTAQIDKVRQLTPAEMSVQP